MRVLLSIKPQFAQSIFSGSKKFEFRKRTFAQGRVGTAIVYASSPISGIVGEFDIDDVIEGTPSDVWQKTMAGAGIDRDYFDEYFHGCQKAFALVVGSVREYDAPLVPKSADPGFVAPQSYRYARIDEPRRWQVNGRVQ